MVLVMLQGWLANANLEANTITPEPRPNVAQTREQIQFFWQIAPFLQDCHIIFSIDVGAGEKRWLHLFIINGEIKEKVTGARKWLREGFFATRKERQQFEGTGK